MSHSGNRVVIKTQTAWTVCTLRPQSTLAGAASSKPSELHRYKFATGCWNVLLAVIGTVAHLLVDDMEVGYIRCQTGKS